MKSISTQLYLSACGALVLLSSSVQAQPREFPWFIVVIDL